MATSPVVLDEGTVLPTSAAAQYTCPANSTVRISAYNLVNYTGTAATYTIHLVESGGSADSSNMIESAVSLGANTSKQISAAIGQVLVAGDSIQAFSGTATAISQRVSGFLIT